MELEKIWKKLEVEKLEVVKPTALAEWPPRSKHPVRKLEQSFLTGLMFILFFEGAFVYLFIDFKHPLVRAFMGLLILCYLFAFLVNYRIYRGIRSEIDFSKDLQQTMSTIYQNVTTALRFQRRAFLFVYPVAASAGFLLGFATQKDPSRVIQETWLLAVMVGLSIALTPIGYWLGTWLEKHSYGKYCAQLKDLITQLELTQKEQERPTT